MGYHAHFDPRLIASADQCAQFTERDKILVHHAMVEEQRTRKSVRRWSNDNEMIAWASVRAQTAQQALAANMAIRQNILANAVPVLQNVRSGSLANMTFGVPQTWTVLASCQKRRRLFGASHTAAATSDPTGFGVNFAVQQGLGTVSTGTPKNFRFVLEIPVVNSNQDLTGAIYANQTTSNNQLQFTINPNWVVFGVDPFYASFVSSAALATNTPTLTNLTWTLYQDFLDQLPVDNTGFAQLPPIDIAYALCYQMINPGVQVAAQDNLYALPPFNVYQDLMLFWDNYTFNGAGGIGTDVNYVKVQISNTYILLQVDPTIAAIRARNMLSVDMPAVIGATTTGSGSVYDLDFRHKPLSVNQLSSTNIVFNPATVAAATSNLQIGQEYVWYANQAAA